MSEYRDFSRCIICRSRKNLEDYSGDFEVTMLLNTLYIAVMYPFEKRSDLHLKSKKIIPKLENIWHVKCFDNSFSTDDKIRYFRNALAHYSMEVAKEPCGEKIETIRLWGINAQKKSRRKEQCDNPRSISKKYNTGDNGHIIEYTFSVDELRKFTDEVLNYMLDDVLPDDICKNCKYFRHEYD